MGIALSMISGGDVALLYDSYLASGGEKASGTAVLGNAKLAEQIGTAASALVGGAIVTLSYGHLLWANAILSWIPMLLVLRVSEPPALLDRKKKWSGNLKEVLSTTLVRDAATRFVVLNMVVWGTGGLVMVWANQKYWQESGVPLAWFGVLWASYNLIAGFAGRSAARARARYGRRPVLTVAGALPIIAFVGMASFLGWGGILLGVLFKVGQGLGGVLFLEALNEKISSTFRATVISMTQLGVRAAFFVLGPLVGYGIDVWGFPSVLSLLGLLFSIAFVGLLLPLVVRETALSPEPAPRLS
jgi:MFS family permease